MAKGQRAERQGAVAARMARTRADKIFDGVMMALSAFSCLVVLYPLIYIISASFSDPYAVAGGKVWLFPVDFSLAGYEFIFQYKYIWSGYANTVFYAFFGTLIAVTLTVLAAYPLSRRDLPGRNWLMFLFTFTMLFSGGMIPTYLLVVDLNIINTRWAMLLPAAMSVWNVIITRTYFESNIPVEVLEASRIDGCTDFGFLLRVVLPLSGAILAINALFYAVGIWNSYFDAFLYLSEQALHPLTIVLRKILILTDINMSSVYDPSASYKQFLRELLKYSLIIVSSGPVLMIYPFVQKYFVRGVMIGSVKG